MDDQIISYQEIGQGNLRRRVTYIPGTTTLHSYADRPATVWLEGPLAGKEWYYRKGKIHREHGVACQFPDGKEWTVHHGQVVPYSKEAQFVLDFYMRYYMNEQPKTIGINSIPAWMQSYFESEKTIVLGKIMTWAYLNKYSLFQEWACAWIAQKMTGLLEQDDGIQTTRECFNLPDDLTPERKRQIAEENVYLLAKIKTSPK